MSLFTLTILSLVAGSILSILSARLLTLSGQRLMAFKKKSTWKLMEIPWLALACASVVLAQQNLELRELEAAARLWQARFALENYSADNTVREFAAKQPKDGNRYGITGCITYNGDNLIREAGIDLASRDPVTDKCVWIALLRWQMETMAHAVAAAEFIVWTDFDSFSLIFRPPFTTADEVEARMKQLPARLSTLPMPRDAFSGFSVCEHRAARDASDEMREMRYIAEIACRAALSAFAFGEVKEEIKSGLLIGNTVTHYWPLLLVLGLCFRINRTAAEFYLDRASESRQ